MKHSIRSQHIGTVLLLLSAVLIGIPAHASADDDHDHDHAHEHMQNIGGIGVTALEEERSALQREVQELEAQISEYRGELAQRHQEISSLQNQIAMINTRIRGLDAEIRRTQNLISITQLNIQETNEAIDEATEKIEQSKAVLSALLRTLYVREQETGIERMVKYRTLSDMLTEMHSLDRIQEELTVVLDETRTTREALEQHNASLRADRNELEDRRRQLAVQQQAQESERQHQDTLLSQTRQEEARYQQLLSAVEQEQAEHLRRLERIEEEIRIQQSFLTFVSADQIPPPGTKIFTWPIQNPIVTQRYGMTAFARRGGYGGHGHNGLDMTGGGIGTPIRSAAGGTIVAKGDRACPDFQDRTCNGFWGNWVAVEHPGGLTTLYAHMTRPSHKSIGQTVEIGEVIGYEGSSGNSTGPHLHFTVYTEFFTYADPTTGETRFSYNYPNTINPEDYL